MVLLEEIPDNAMSSASTITPQAGQSVSNIESNGDGPKTDAQVGNSSEARVGAGAGVSVSVSDNVVTIVFPTAAEAAQYVSRIETVIREAQAATTFTCFSKLPAELRIKIWKYSYQESRTIKAKLSSPQPVHWGPYSLPAALHVCQESRVEALKTYELLSFDPEKVSPEEIYFDFRKDVLAIFRSFDATLKMLHMYMSDKHFSMLKFLRVEWREVSRWQLSSKWDPQGWAKILRPLLDLTNLVEIIAVKDIRMVKNWDEENTRSWAQGVDERFKNAVVMAFRKQRAGDKAFDGVGDVVYRSEMGEEGSRYY